MYMLQTETDADSTFRNREATLETPVRRYTKLTGKRVLFIHSSLHLGGAELQSLHLANYLMHRQGAVVEMWGLSSPGPLADRCDHLGIPWRAVPVEWRPGRWNQARDLFRLARVLNAARPDVLLPYCDIPNVLCGAVWRWTGARLCIWNQRGLDTMCQGSRLARRVIRQSRWFISNSGHRRDYLVDTFDIPPERVHVIRNGVALAQAVLSRGQWREKLGLDSKTFVACMVANLNWYKDPDTVLKAWRRVVDQAETATPVLLFAGRFSDKATQLKALCFDLGLERSVRFLGFVDDVPGLLGASDLCVFSSQAEGIPNGVLESMAAGLPVVATDDPSTREALGPDGYPYLASPGHVEGIADRILEFAADPAARARVGNLNRLRIQAEFSVQAMCEQTAALIAGAVSGMR